MPSEEQTLTKVSFLIRELSLQSSMRILDLGCGRGAIANALARLGMEVVGADITHGFLEIARAEAACEGLKVQYVLRDMREISWDEEFDAVLLIFSTLGYFGGGDNLRILENIARALKYGGLLCFDIPCCDEEPGDFLINDVSEIGKILQMAGLRLERAYGSWKSAPVAADSERIIVVARKI